MPVVEGTELSIEVLTSGDPAGIAQAENLHPEP